MSLLCLLAGPLWSATAAAPHRAALVLATDVFTAPGHPGLPQQGDLIEDNNFYSNNFNPYAPSSDIKPSEPEPVGTGLWIAGGNDNVVRYNHFYDNWRRGTMLFAVPDASVCGPGQSDVPVPGCDSTKFSTSYRDSFYGNVMGVAPDGAVKPNGTDFWWDDYPSNTGNCWYKNVAAPVRSITTSPSSLPNCDNGTNPSSSVGTGDPQNEGELGACLADFTAVGYDPTACSWFEEPPKPGAAADRPSVRLSGAVAWVPRVSHQVCHLYVHEYSAACFGRLVRRA